MCRFISGSQAGERGGGEGRRGLDVWPLNDLPAAEPWTGLSYTPNGDVSTSTDAADSNAHMQWPS